MTKYVVKYKESGKVFREYASPEEASERLMWFITCYNELSYSEDYYISRLDFLIEEVETSVEDFISDFESAKRYLKMKGPNEKHKEALIAIDQLFTIAEAWNKADGFVPDFSDCEQFKWIPCFKYDKDSARFVYYVSSYTTEYASACLAPHFCFMTPERAEQFGRQFADLYNKVFLINK